MSETVAQVRRKVAPEVARWLAGLPVKKQIDAMLIAQVWFSQMERWHPGGESPSRDR